MISSPISLLTLAGIFKCQVRLSVYGDTMKVPHSYIGTLPYASELFGVYQPLLGWWKSQITARRIEVSSQRAYVAIANKVLNQVRSPITVPAQGEQDMLKGRFLNAQFTVEGLKPIDLEPGLRPILSSSIDSGVTRLLRERVGDEPPHDWQELVNPDRMTQFLEQLQKILTDPEQLAQRPEISTYVDSFVAALGPQDRPTLLRALFDKESRIAGYLIFLAQHAPSQLTALFFRLPKTDILRLAAFSDPLLNFGDDAYRAILSPIGIIHLYREYFFEFDSFLGPAVGHVWLSPGGTIELIEVNTRKVFTEQTLEMVTETVRRSESQTTTQDDISDAIKEENRSDMKFGFTNTASYTVPVFQDNATASFSLDNAKTTSRETTYKHMRQQSEKLSSEIKRNFKTTFRTSTEVTDTTSKRYVLQNTTKRLVNYELRRKMRKVGVQVQDIGVQLCWHTFVDDPGRELGISKLVHMGEKPDLSGLVAPEAPVFPTDETQEVSFAIQFVGLNTDDNEQAYTNGTETEVEDIGDRTENILADFPQSVTFTKPGYTLEDGRLEAVGFDAKVSYREQRSDEGSSTGTFVAHIDYVNWNGASQFTVKAILTWKPSKELHDKIDTAYNAAIGKFNAESHRRYKEAFIQASRERIKLASNIQQRRVEDLREEERTVVYRRLISQLMSVAPKESKHVISELIRSIFDVDKMLYFVAPEWWIPRLHQSTQQLGKEITPPGAEQAAGGKPAAEAASGSAVSTALAKFGPSAVSVETVLSYTETKKIIDLLPEAPLKPTPIPSEYTVDWGGAKEYGRDNYYITEDSAPAKLGSSLGWLLQLDGDNLRNALLNAPWVKAVIPIRIGKEREAINWLRQAHVEGNDGLDAHYVAAPDDPPELQSIDHEITVLEALTILTDKIKAFDQRSRTTIIPNPADPEDPSNHFAGSLPTEAVFESGFYPLKGGIRFNQEGTDQAIFSQWMEILPTDQIVALEVDYDPKTLQVKVTPQPPREGEPDDDPL